MVLKGKSRFPLVKMGISRFPTAACPDFPDIFQQFPESRRPEKDHSPSSKLTEQACSGQNSSSAFVSDLKDLT